MVRVATPSSTAGGSGRVIEYLCRLARNLAHFIDRGLVKPPFFVQMIFGILGGIGPDFDNLEFMKRIADRLFGPKSYQWSVLAAGKYQMSFLTQAAQLGGNVRVGPEDSLFLERGRMAASNAEQVVKIRRILAEMGREPATPARRGPCWASRESTRSSSEASCCHAERSWVPCSPPLLWQRGPRQPTRRRR